MLYPLKGKGVFFFCDSAGAYASLSLAFILEKETQIPQVLYSNQDRYGQNQFGLKVEKIEDSSKIDLTKFDFIFTGTSHPDRSKGFELRAINAAKGKIKSYSFVDHWTNIALRFRLGNEFIIPDEVWVIDDLAKKKAIEEGMPEGNLKIWKNPFHFFLKRYWRSKFSDREYLRSLFIPFEDEKILLYAPDPISMAHTENNNSINEFYILQELIQILNINFSENFLLIVKIHPIQEITQYLDLLKGMRNRIRIYVLKEADSIELLRTCDVVIGFFSNILLEAECLNKKVIRFIPPEMKDHFSSMNVGVVVKTKDELTDLLRNII